MEPAVSSPTHVVALPEVTERESSRVCKFRAHYTIDGDVALEIKLAAVPYLSLTFCVEALHFEGGAQLVADCEAFLPQARRSQPSVSLHVGQLQLELCTIAGVVGMHIMDVRGGQFHYDGTDAALIAYEICLGVNLTARGHARKRGYLTPAAAAAVEW
jgi:hypothetical protein